MIEGEKMDTDVKAARRNLLIVCSTFWVYHIGEGELGDSPKFPFVSVTLSNPDALYWIAYGMFLWLSWRYGQYATKEMDRLRAQYHEDAALSAEQQNRLAVTAIEKGFVEPANIEMVTVWRKSPMTGGRYGTRGGVFTWNLCFDGVKERDGGTFDNVQGARVLCKIPWNIALGMKLKRLAAFTIRNPALVEVILPHIAIAATVGLCIWRAFIYFS